MRRLLLEKLLNAVCAGLLQNVGGFGCGCDGDARVRGSALRRTAAPGRLPALEVRPGRKKKGIKC